ncbi:MAG: alkaline phosphatase family protein [Steroidobacteraceae bacterium]
MLGVDSVDLLLMQRWSAQGLLPFFNSMLESGSLVRLSTVSRILQGSVWPGLLSGRSPGQHGTYFLTQLTNGTYNLDRVRADHGQLDPYYLHLDANGVRCALVDVPDDLPHKQFQGFQVTDWLTEFEFWHFTVHNRLGKPDIAARFEMMCKTGGYGPTTQTLEGHRNLRQRLERGIELKGVLAKELLARSDLDHLFIVFGETHKAGHLLWKYMDPAHPDHVAAEPYLRDAVLSIYQAVDRQLAELAADLKPDDNLLIFSDHGMQPNYRGDHFIVPMLQRLGLCEPDQVPMLESLQRAAPPPKGAKVSAPAAGRRFGQTKDLIKRLAPQFATTYLRHKFGVPSRIDWDRTRAFQLPTDRNSYLRVNVRGREPNGIVARGAEYQAVLSLLETEFRALVNVETGRPAVEEVFRIHELFPGPRVDDLPDLAVLWNSEAPINSVESPRLGRLDIPAREDRAGNHRPEGFILAKGPAIRPNVGELHGDVLQIPATFLALHGVSIPAHFEMGPMHQLLASEIKRGEDRVPAGVCVGLTPPNQAHLPGRRVPAHQATPGPSP